MYEEYPKMLYWKGRVSTDKKAITVVFDAGEEKEMRAEGWLNAGEQSMDDLAEAAQAALSTSMLDDLTKKELAERAEKNHRMELDPKMRKDEMIERIRKAEAEAAKHGDQ